MKKHEREYLRGLYINKMVQRTSPAFYAGLRAADKDILKNKLTAEIMLLEQIAEKFDLQLPAEESCEEFLR